MKVKILIGVIATALAMALSAPAFAEVREGSSELGIHTGWITGDDLTSKSVSGSTPELDDSWMIGASYSYNFTPNFGLETRYAAQFSETFNNDLDVHIFDIINAVWHFNPESKTVFYGTAGVGWAFANMDGNISGTIDSVPDTISDGDGFTLNIGGGVKLYTSENIFWRGDVRYRFLSELVDKFDEDLNTFEITAGIGLRF